MFEEMTEEYLLQQAENMGRELGVDVRQGSIYMDAAAGHCLRAAKFFEDLKTTFNLLMIDTATEDILDSLVSEHAVSRLLATPSEWGVTFTGTIPNVGERFFINGYYFILRNNGVDYLEAEIPGTSTNSLTPGEAVVPVNNIAGLTSATLGELIAPGTDDERDDSLRSRVKDKISGQAKNQNRQQFKTWCEEVSGVGRARILSLWNGPNTVKGIIIATDGTPPLASVVEDVQNYIDPGSTGLGDGVANMGAYFTAVAAIDLPVSVSFSVVLRDGYLIEQTKADAEKAIRVYLKNLALESAENELVVVRISSIGALIYGLSSVLDYSDLLLNNGTTNIEVNQESVATLGEVIVSVSV